MYGSLEKIFPDQFNRSKEYNYWEKIKRRAILVVEDTLQPDEDKAKMIDEINKWIVSQIKPKDVAKEEMLLEKNYEELCILLGKHTSQPVKRMTVFEYYTLLSLIKQKKLQ